MAKDDLCEFCTHRRDGHHQGCSLCHAEPDRHGLYCMGALCCCVQFAEPDDFVLTDQDIEAMTA